MNRVWGAVAAVAFLASAAEAQKVDNAAPREARASMNEDDQAHGGQGSVGPFSQAAIEAEVAAARDWLQLSLVDYESAKFQRVRVVLVSPDRRNKRNVTLVVCGLVNSKNRMGGYTGYQVFHFGRGLPAWNRASVSASSGTLCAPANAISGQDYSDRLSPGYRQGAGQ